ncbi:tRNA (guanine-N1)-methyltransferase [Corynebacterium atypicum]|uniref:tRNA (guanine-N(1)-)-methyltransferase n=1 Tax=Corynebacterium atypicum TaxID=191610 RepID=A0ABN4DC97_9CORY|nr:tRNA (guanosine(37)-N1)-methyltransferase TrmD [Corynebacterium atypicum]AIG63948.1 tRNA (guanine-N1)-methyltransferase [Corynebacterium atypicum]
MRLDVITIFPEYLDPLRHALLGKAIEEGRLVVGVHDLRDWAQGVHQSVDDSPFGGGPGMVMSPQVWGPALDSVAQGRTGTTLHSAEPHRDTARHDDIHAHDSGQPAAGVGEPGEKGGEDRPLLIVPTPAGERFTQQLAEEFSKEEHIVFACGRYEGIDQRVMVDAVRRYRVREVSIGDYVLIGGEVAALVIAEAVVRLVPGVLGNHRSHEEDSFSDGLLEGPCYTKPRTWRGLSVPEVLTGGNHAAIGRWHREQALQRTKERRPELLDTAELTADDRAFVSSLDYPQVTTQLEVLIAPKAWKEAAQHLPRKLAKRGVYGADVHAQQVDFSCEPDNVLVAEYEQANARPPVAEVVHHVVVSARSQMPHREVTQAVVGCLPRGTLWYGSTVAGVQAANPSGVACALPEEDAE